MISSGCMRMSRKNGWNNGRCASAVGIIFRMIIVMTFAEKSTVKIVWFHASGRWCDVLQTLPPIVGHILIRVNHVIAWKRKRRTIKISLQHIEVAGMDRWK
jgi:hypothetical protein